jgi:hypothetical protein
MPKRPVALTMPAVTELSSPKGLPTATTHSPTSSCSESPHSTGVSPEASTLITARSVSASEPTTVAGTSRPSASFTDNASAPGDDVVIRENRAIVGDDDARAHAGLALLEPAPLEEVLAHTHPIQLGDVDDRWIDTLRDPLEGLDNALAWAISGGGVSGNVDVCCANTEGASASEAARHAACHD